MYENEPKWGESQAGRPRPGRPAYPCHILPQNFERSHWTLGSGHTKMGSAISQVKIERPKQCQVEPKSSDNPKNQGLIQLVKQCGPREQQVGATRA